MGKKLYNIRFNEVADAYSKRNYREVVRLATIFLDNRDKKNQTVRFMRVKAYEYLGKYGKAIDDLEYTLSYDRYNNYSLTELLFLFYQLKEYEKVLYILPDVYEAECVKRDSLYIMEIIIKKALNIPIEKRNDNSSYLIEQLFNYDEAKAIEHVKLHNFKNDTFNSEDRSYFNDNINVEALFKLIQGSLSKAKKAGISEVLEKYYFPICNIGYYKGEMCDYIKVVVEPNTNNIMTMYPTVDIDVRSLSSLNGELSSVFQVDESKVKTFSRIDRFNQKYKR